MATNLCATFLRRLCAPRYIQTGCCNNGMVRRVTTSSSHTEKKDDSKVTATEQPLKQEKVDVEPLEKVGETKGDDKPQASHKKEEVGFQSSTDDDPQTSLVEDPHAKLVRVLKYGMARTKESWMTMLGFEFESKLEKHYYGPSHTDILIIGGGAMGSSCAYWIKEKVKEGLQVVVVERDLTYKSASTSLSVGGLRQQFSLPESIQMSLYGAEFMRSIHRTLKVENLPDPNVCFQPYGYLMLASEEGADTLSENSEMQNSMGANNILLTPKRLKDRFPWLNTDGIALGCLGLENEGWFDPWALMFAFKTKAISLGADYVNSEVVGFQFESPEGGCIYDERYRQVRGAIVRRPNGELHVIHFSRCIIAAGAESGAVGKFLGLGVGEGILRVPLPVERRKRYVYFFHSPNGPGMNTPLTIDPNGVYFRREGYLGNYITGQSPNPDEEPETDNLDVDYQYFDNKVWPALANRVPSFENLKMKSAWAGYYEYNPIDMNGIVGHHPLHTNIFFACGFSGHGIQHAPAVGRAVSELILNDGYLTIDLHRLGFTRFLNQDLLLEKNIV